jgi:hypothetical protein
MSDGGDNGMSADDITVLVSAISPEFPRTDRDP